MDATTRYTVSPHAGRTLAIRLGYALLTGVLTAALLRLVNLAEVMEAEVVNTATPLVAVMLFVIGVAAGFVGLLLLDVLLWLSAKTAGLPLALRDASRTVSGAAWPLMVGVLIAIAAVFFVAPSDVRSQAIPAVAVAATFAAHVALVFLRPGPFATASPSRRGLAATLYIGVPVTLIVISELAR